MADTWEPYQNSEVLDKVEVLTMKLVNVPHIDSEFSIITTAFNRQQQNCFAMEKAAQKLKELSGCPLPPNLTACLRHVQQEHGDCNVQVHMEGYSFSLVIEEENVPDQLQQVQQCVEELSFFTKCVLTAEAPLQQMTSWVLQNQMQFAETIQSENPEYLDQARLGANLTQNIQKVSLVKELSKENSEKAKSILMEMAQLAGLTL